MAHTTISTQPPATPTSPMTWRPTSSTTPADLSPWTSTPQPTSWISSSAPQAARSSPATPSARSATWQTSAATSIATKTGSTPRNKATCSPSWISAWARKSTVSASASAPSLRTGRRSISGTRMAARAPSSRTRISRSTCPRRDMVCLLITPARLVWRCSPSGRRESISLSQARRSSTSSCMATRPRTCCGDIPPSQAGRGWSRHGVIISG